MVWRRKGRTLFWFVASVAITLGLSAVLWLVFDSPVFFGFLFLPFLFGGGRLFGGRAEDAERPTVRTCPQCGFQSMDPQVAFCPRDGRRLH